LSMADESETAMGETKGVSESVVEAGEPSARATDPKTGDGRIAELEEALKTESEGSKILKDEIKPLLDDIDRLEEKLKFADEDIEELLFELKKLQLKLDSHIFKKKEYEAVRKEAGDLRSKVSEQEEIIEEQLKQLDEQEYLLYSLEKELDGKTLKSAEFRSQRIDEGRKSYHDGKMELKDKAISKLKNAVELLREEQKKEKESARLAAAYERIEIIETQLEDLQHEIKALRETTRKENKIHTKSKYAAHEWKLRAEAAEKKLAELGSTSSKVSSLGTYVSKGDPLGGSESSDQGLLLQGVIANKIMKQGWSLGGLFGAGGAPSTSDSSDANQLLRAQMSAEKNG
jgi:DNA repair exonuclease SbcCD ATPase subunit